MRRLLTLGFIILSSLKQAAQGVMTLSTSYELPPECSENGLSAFSLNRQGTELNNGKIVVALGDIHVNEKHGRSLLACHTALEKQAAQLGCSMNTYTEHHLSLTKKKHYALWDSVAHHKIAKNKITNSLDFMDFILFAYEAEFNRAFARAMKTNKQATSMFYLNYGKLIGEKIKKTISKYGKLAEKINTYKLLKECYSNIYSIKRCSKYIFKEHMKIANQLNLKLLLRVYKLTRRSQPALFRKLFNQKNRGPVYNLLQIIETCSENQDRNRQMIATILASKADIIVVIAGSRHFYNRADRITDEDTTGVLKLLTQGPGNQNKKINNLRMEIRARAAACQKESNKVPYALRLSDNLFAFLVAPTSSTSPTNHITQAGFWNKYTRKYTPDTCDTSTSVKKTWF